jgi:O-glycosyl hydrolase
MMKNVHRIHPNVAMHWTEGGPDYTSQSYLVDWVTWAQTFIGVLNNGCASITGWNLALDERGRPNIGPFSCGGLVTIHSRTKEITPSGQYHACAHFSRSIQRGARVYASTSKSKNLAHVACRNRDGRNILIISKFWAQMFCHGARSRKVDQLAAGLRFGNHRSLVNVEGLSGHLSYLSQILIDRSGNLNR